MLYSVMENALSLMAETNNKLLVSFVIIIAIIITTV